MKRKEAIELISSRLSDHVVFHANGHICRESFQVDDREGNFYMIGSMGLAPSMALGLALACPEKKVVVFDGDGSVLMNMGNLAMVGSVKPKNFLHVVLDNETYGSTGEQATISRDVPLDEVALSSGYALVEKVDFDEPLNEKLEKCLNFNEGPAFLLIKVYSSDGENCPRVSWSPEEITKRFMKAVLQKTEDRT